MALNTTFTNALEAQIDQLKRDRVYKRLNYLESPQSARVKMEGRGEVVILSSNNYLGLCDEPAVVEAGIEGLRRYGAGSGRNTKDRDNPRHEEADSAHCRPREKGFERRSANSVARRAV